MKTYLLVAVAACSLLAAGAPSAQAAPKGKKSESGSMEAKMADMMKDKNMRMMAIKELMSTKERKMELAKMLKPDKEFNQIFGNLTTGGG